MGVRLVHARSLPAQPDACRTLFGFGPILTRCGEHTYGRVVAIAHFVSPACRKPPVQARTQTYSCVHSLLTRRSVIELFPVSASASCLCIHAHLPLDNSLP